ncbi:hypothetical protein C1S99_26735 [Vibrio parahaemolyticus]|uniref:hypothetical protein n=2 Tax=Vibrio parahaemolyticus TaxID=670 RepID=UPI000C86CB78|nr:hypothetical protein [Vibrio parahaemolyticus]EJB8691853.1 hypothetical protein [Vibrio parahaemolyticus]PMS38964.1 hypothetical protein C1T12_26880 [Vibrio parahaemolyticus]PMS56727.1 hypothetical protein C1S91_26800 [Vibrio parahaemolyticus]PMS65086.1 hypothetical protein C1S96_26860 [Vibrio parahaemolyticus]PMS70292.1 hypothetical protein C1T10_26785 [Vibrio parahaemolyticus]
MNKELKNNLIMAFVGACIASGGFIAEDYFDSENQKKKFAFDLHKKLYDDSAKVLKSVNRTYFDLYGIYGKDFALTPTQLSDKHRAFKKSLELYLEYIDELERYGSTEQVQVINNHRKWLWGIYAELDLQLKLSEQVVKKAKDLLLVEDVKSEWFASLNRGLESDIERLVRNENRIYYAIDHFKKPVVDGIEQYVNHIFRTSLNISPTTDMALKINSLQSLIDKSNNFKYKEKALPFFFAEGRVFQSPELEFQGDDSVMEHKNSILAYNMKMKFLAEALETDEYLRNVLEERKKNATRSEPES